MVKIDIVVDVSAIVREVSNLAVGSTSIGDGGDASGRMPSNINYSGYDLVQQGGQSPHDVVIPGNGDLCRKK
eukprot:gene15881-35399_t